MTDKEMAKEFVEGEHYVCRWDMEQTDLEEIAEEAFLAGLEAGRPKWHKVADGDLPQGEDAVLIYWKFGDRRCFSVVEPYKVTEDKNILAWCEIPQYTEE